LEQKKLVATVIIIITQTPFVGFPAELLSHVDLFYSKSTACTTAQQIESIDFEFYMKY